jgi:mannose-6-phosphate isomerase-like protein (cupin superfamily)
VGEQPNVNGQADGPPAIHRAATAAEVLPAGGLARDDRAVTEAPDDDVPFDEQLLPVRHMDIAPDGSRVRVLARLPRGGMAHFELASGEVSRAQRHRSVSEIWYILEGLGVMWRQQGSGEGREIDLRPGVCLTIPVGTSFQFCSTGRNPLAAIGVTMPPWPGERESVPVEGPWTPTV